MNSKDYDDMSNEELIELYQQDLTNNEIPDYFLKRNEKLIYLLAKRYMKGFPNYAEDIYQDCILEMWNCMKRFDKSFDCKFTAYYNYYALKGIQSFLRRELNPIRIPAYLIEDIAKAKGKYESIKYMLYPLSLNEVLNTDTDCGGEIQDYVSDGLPNPQDLLEQADSKEQLLKLLKTLSPRQEKIMILWLGLDSDDSKFRTLEEIGGMFNLTRERIRQIIDKAVIKLRRNVHLYLDVDKYTKGNKRVYTRNCYSDRIKRGKNE